MSGKLLLIGTPIGNLTDMTPRAIEAIESCTRLLCEDTRHTRKLLSHFSISVPVESFHEHNEDAKTAEILEALRAGETIGMVSDAGMPLLSDPGFALVRAARQHNIKVEPIPGPVAAILALVASGIRPFPFTFYGFAPHRAGARRQFYRTIAAAQTTAIVYESPERVVASLGDAQQELGDVEITVARELTKLHEEFLHGSIREVAATLAKRERIRGEITIVLAPASPAAQEVSPDALRAEFRRLRDGGLRRNDAIKLLSDHFKLKKNELYRMLLDESD
jgi:16S rRNA (cytidine1402-2'-O)-methyltransferase